MPDGPRVDRASVDLAMAMYEQEREDERVFWSSTTGLLYGSLTIPAGGVAALVSTDAESAYVYAVVPFLVLPQLAIFLLQAAAGGRRRHYMAALELYLKEALAKDELTMVFRESGTWATSKVPITVYTRYSWILTTPEPWAPLTARLIFAVTVIGPVMVAMGTIVAANVQMFLLHGHGTPWLAVGVTAIASVGVSLLISYIVLAQDRSVQSTIRVTPRDFY